MLCSKVYRRGNDRIAKRPDTWPNVRAISLRSNHAWNERECVSLVGVFAPQSNVQVLAPPMNTCYECEGMLVANQVLYKCWSNSGRESYFEFEVHNMQSILQPHSVWQQACSCMAFATILLNDLQYTQPRACGIQ